MSGRTIELEMYVHAETEKAILVSEDGEEDNAVWLPKSQIEYESDGDMATVQCPEFIAIDRGLV
jgi:hypothetical protein